MTKNQMKEFNIYLFLYSKLMIYNKVLSGLFNITLIIILVNSFQLKKNGSILSLTQKHIPQSCYLTNAPQLI